MTGGVRSVRVEVDLPAIRANLATARRLSGGGKLFATVKADAYGHGAVAVAQALSASAPGQPHRHDSELADGFAVVTLDEALELRDANISQPILVLQGPQDIEAFAVMEQHKLWPVIHDLQQYEAFRHYAQRDKLPAWLKVDTGMGRLGVQPAEADKILSADEGIHWHGLMTHFASADETTKQTSIDFTRQQIDSFAAIRSPRMLERSMANSAAVLSWPTARADWARPGIMLYGCNPLDKELPEGIELQPAMSVSAPLISVKQLAAGAGIGYAQTYHCPEAMPVGYVALGYRDGIPRILNEHASVVVAGIACPVIGRVSMDSMAIDLRKVHHLERAVRMGDPVEFWGKQVSADHLAAAAGTISYELLTSIRGRVTYQE